MLPEPTLNSYLMLSAVLFAIGTAGVFLRRNIITILLSIEVMLNAVNLTFVAADRYLNLIDGQIIVFFVMTVAAAEAAGGLRAIAESYSSWLSSGPIQIPLAFRLDPLSSLMVLVVTGIGSLIHLYSTAYMHDEKDGEYARYFSYLNLFAAFMLVLVLGANFPVMFIGWEGVGLCSYLLIGFWFVKPSAV